MSPLSSMRIMLKKQVVLTVMPHQTIGVVHPVFNRREMKLWPILAI